LDSFITPTIPGFEGDVPILAIPLSAHPFDSQIIEDSTVGTSTERLWTQAGKRKASTTPTPQKTAKKSSRKSLGGIKINEPMPQKPASTPLSGPRNGVPIFCSKRYAYI
jgi:hypothetical protein